MTDETMQKGRMPRVIILAVIAGINRKPKMTNGPTVITPKEITMPIIR